MILAWKARRGSYRASWNRTELVLYEDKATGCWRMTADGAPVKETWTSARRAMEATETKLTKIVLANAVDKTGVKRAS
jgi:hypothetical protein